MSQFGEGEYRFRLDPFARAGDPVGLFVVPSATNTRERPAAGVFPHSARSRSISSLAPLCSDERRVALAHTRL
jgi:hypothetical protein